MTDLTQWTKHDLLDLKEMSKEEIEKMVNEAEQFKAEDDRQREIVAARNQLEAYCFSVKQALSEYGDKLSADDKKKAESACEDALRWINGNNLADKEEFEHKLKEVQGICMSIMGKLHQESGRAGSCHQQAGQGTAGYQGPTVEEVD